MPIMMCTHNLDRAAIAMRCGLGKALHQGRLAQHSHAES